MANESKLSRRTRVLVWLVGAALIIGTFIYLEQIAILYVVATLALVSLLVIVAFADLEHIGQDRIKAD